MVIVMNYEILDEEGNVINTIVADLDFMEEHYPGQFREREEVLLPPRPPLPEQPETGE